MAVAIKQVEERQRSTIQFPYGSLNDAKDFAKNIFDGGGQQGTPDQVAAWTGHQIVDSGAFRTKLATARIFGVVNVARHLISLTELGHDIIDVKRERQARAHAFLHVPLYRAIYEKYRGKMLPGDKPLENEFVLLGVAHKQADKARQAFQRSAEQAGFFAQGRDHLIMPANISAPDKVKDATNADRGDPPAVTLPQGNPGPNYTELHPFIRGLLEALPPPHAAWSKEERAAWLATAHNIFGLLYKEQ
jgi:hypothetical protein